MWRPSAVSSTRQATLASAHFARTQSRRAAGGLAAAPVRDHAGGSPGAPRSPARPSRSLAPRLAGTARGCRAGSSSRPLREAAPRAARSCLAHQQGIAAPRATPERRRSPCPGRAGRLTGRLALGVCARSWRSSSNGTARCRVDGPDETAIWRSCLKNRPPPPTAIPTAVTFGPAPKQGDARRRPRQPGDRPPGRSYSRLERLGRWARRVPSVGRYHGSSLSSREFSVIRANAVLPSASRACVIGCRNRTKAGLRARDRLEKLHQQRPGRRTPRGRGPTST